MFEKTWVSAPASTAASDGLGPFFNARSCSACHPRGGRGDLADSRIIVTDDSVYGEFLQTRAVQGLPAEGQVRTITRDHIILLDDGTEVAMHQPHYELDDMQYGELHKSVSARIAPSLAGLRLLEQVPVEYLKSLADPDDTNGDGISGRISEVPEAATGKVMTGRFGWKAESYSLTMQIAKALSLDMGLGNAIFPSAFGDCTPSQASCLQMASGNSPSITDSEISDTILNLLLTYLQSLAPAHQQSEVAAAGGSVSKVPEDNGIPVPVEIPSQGNTVGVTETALTGENLFDNLGCSACHRSSLPAGDQSISPFTDLLMHDMGPELAAEANDFVQAAEWRTAPLWGLATVRFYLHDGRATSLEEAILWHGGEATQSVNLYKQLTESEREILHSWLHRL